MKLDDWSQWWRFVAGADWKHPRGPAAASKAGTITRWYRCRTKMHWPMPSGRASACRLKPNGNSPPAADWSRRHMSGARSLQPNGQRMANTFDGQFPVVNPKAGGAVGTTAVRTFPANGYGLYDMTGNAWQWVADQYRADYFQQQAKNEPIENPQGPSDSYDPDDRSAPPNAPKRVTRGGSFLCAVNYCLSYRPSARRGNDPYNPMSHIGFRLVTTQQESGANEDSSAPSDACRKTKTRETRKEHNHERNARKSTRSPRALRTCGHGTSARQEAQHPRHLGRRHRHLEHQPQQPRHDGLQDAEHRSHRQGRRRLHRLLRAAELHRGSRGLHQRHACRCAPA